MREYRQRLQPCQLPQSRHMQRVGEGAFHLQVRKIRGHRILGLTQSRCHLNIRAARSDKKLVRFEPSRAPLKACHVHR